MTTGTKTMELTLTRAIPAPHTWVSRTSRVVGSVVTLNHANLPDDEKGRVHEGGWKQCLDAFGEPFSRKRRVEAAHG